MAPSREKRWRPWWLALAAAFLLSPVLSARLNPNAYQGGRSRNAEARALRNSSSIANMLGECRTAMSDVMYLKTERYLHGGIGYQPHLQKQLLSVSGATAGFGEHQEEAGGCTGDHDHGEHDHAEHDDHDGHLGCTDGTPTLIRTPDRDYRGFVGDLQRAVKPWRDPGDHAAHSDGIEVLPWYRMMTLSDPNYIRGYTLGGWWLKRRNPGEALRFVEEGLANNPGAFQVHLAKAQILLHQARETNGGHLDPLNDGARALCEEAAAAFARAADLAVDQRPAGWSSAEDDPRWNDYMDDDALAAARMAVTLARRLGRPADADRMLKTYRAALGDDPALLRMAGQSASLPHRN